MRLYCGAAGKLQAELAISKVWSQNARGSKARWYLRSAKEVRVPGKSAFANVSCISKKGLGRKLSPPVFWVVILRLALAPAEVVARMLAPAPKVCEFVGVAAELSDGRVVLPRFCIESRMLARPEVSFSLTRESISGKHGNVSQRSSPSKVCEQTQANTYGQ